MKKPKEKKTKVRKLRLQTKFNIMFTLFALVIGVLMYESSQAIVMGTNAVLYWKRAQGAAYISANYLKQGGFADDLWEMRRDEDYEHMVQRLTMFKQALNVHDIIVFVPGRDSAAVYIALQSDEDSPLQYGDIIPYSEEDHKELLPHIQEGILADSTVITHNTHSRHDTGELSAWAGVKNENGQIAAVVEVDIRSDELADILKVYAAVMIVSYVLIVLIGRGIQLFVTRRILIRPLQEITDRATGFATGDQLAGFENDIRTGDELQVLNEALGKMAKDISLYTERKAQIAANDERAASEQKVAARMRDGMRPARPEAFLKKYDIWLEGRLTSSPWVDGEAYDYFALDDDRMAVVMLSIKASGLAAAVPLLVARTIIRSQLRSGQNFSEAMTEINHQLYEQLPQHDIPLRVFVGVLDGVDHKLTYINADNNAPILMCRGRSYAFLRCPPYAPMGQVENVSYQERTVELYQGDRLLWYSDGVLSCPDENGEPLGVDGLKKLLNDQRVPTPEALMEKLDALSRASADTTRVMVLLECHRVDQKRSQLRVEPKIKNIGKVRGFVRDRLDSQPLQGRDRAQLLVCAEEYFSICCRYVQRGMVEISCVPEEMSVALRFTADMNGLDPFAHDAGETMGNAVDFIRKYTDKAETRVLKDCTVMTMSKKWTSRQ